MHPQKIQMAVINVVGGVSVLGSYVYGAYALFTGSPWLQGRWNFAHHAPWPFALDVLLNDASLDLQFLVYTDAANFSVADVVLPGGGIPAGPGGTLVVDFHSFVVAGGGGADFSDVGAVELVIDGVGAGAVAVAFDSFRSTPAIVIDQR